MRTWPGSRRCRPCRFVFDRLWMIDTQPILRRPSRRRSQPVPYVGAVAGPAERHARSPPAPPRSRGSQRVRRTPGGRRAAGAGPAGRHARAGRACAAGSADRRCKAPGVPAAERHPRLSENQLVAEAQGAVLVDLPTASMVPLWLLRSLTHRPPATGSILPGSRPIRPPFERHQPSAGRAAHLQVGSHCRGRRHGRSARYPDGRTAGASKTTYLPDLCMTRRSQECA